MSVKGTTDTLPGFSARRKAIRTLYRGKSKSAIRFRYGLILFDIAVLAYLFISSFFYGHPLIEIIDVALGIIVLADFLARLYITKNRSSFIINIYGIADILTIISLLLPLSGESMAFLRVVRVLRLLRSYEVIYRLREDFKFFKEHELIIISATNLLLFIFVMTAIVFETQVEKNPAIGNYIDALYFTVTTLTTTGFGDITLIGDSGKLVAVLIMIFGVSLFIRLIQTVFRPNKVRHKCSRCGLMLHDRDAVHCKACGEIIDIPHEGLS